MPDKAPIIKFDKWLAKYENGALNDELSALLAEIAGDVRLAGKAGAISMTVKIAPQALLCQDTTLATFVLDDHPAAGGAAANREHNAVLVLRPTPAAKRWGAVFGASCSQENMLDLIVDGMTEIAKPDGSVLHDLISDLHAIRTTSAKSVIRASGGSAVEIAENVNLHAGTGDKVAVPPTLTTYFRPFVGFSYFVTLVVKIKPVIGGDNKVHFHLSAPELDTALTDIVLEIASDLDVGARMTVVDPDGRAVPVHPFFPTTTGDQQ